MVKKQFCFLSFVFVIFSFIFASCNVEWFADFSKEQENLNSTVYKFILEIGSDNSYLRSLKLGETYTAAQLAPSMEFIQAKLGYDFTGWTVNEASAENIEVDAFSKLTSLKVGYKPYSFTGNWVVSTHTPYFVKYYLQNLDDTDYTVDESLTEIQYGETFTTPNPSDIEQKSITGFTWDSNVYAEISADGSSVCKVYYTRNEHTLKIDNNDGTTASETQTKYGAAITLPEPARGSYIFAGWICTDGSGNTIPVPDTMPDYDVIFTASWIYQSDTFYVSSSGNDANEGSNTNPFASIQKAVDAVTTLNESWSGQNFKINIITKPDDGNCIVNLDYSKVLNLTIQGNNNNAASLSFMSSTINNTIFTFIGNSVAPQNLNITLKNLQISAYTSCISDSSYIDVKNATLNIENCKFTDGKSGLTAVYIRNGADVTLSGCDITGNESSDTALTAGCGIINEGKLTLKGKNTIKTSDSSSTKNNVLLSADNKFYIDSTFDSASEIYFTLKNYPSYNSILKTCNPVTITSGAGSTDISGCFKCAEEGYTVMQDSGTNQVIVTKTLGIGGVEIRYYDNIVLTVTNSGGTIALTTDKEVTDFTVDVYNAYGINCGTITLNPTLAGSSWTFNIPAAWPSGLYNVNVIFKYNGVVYSDTIQVTK